MKKTIPAVSIIIPMYNAEKYIGECLDSILAQTFDDYEVILVDDCSTDNSVTIAESYLPKFNGKLQLIRRETNSGGAAIPLNLGLGISRGEYIFTMGNDDVITKTALNELYSVAVSTRADVVHCEKYYLASDENINTDVNSLTVASNDRVIFAKEPILISDNLAERVNDFCSDKFFWTTWLNLIRRDFLIKSDLKFQEIQASEDLLFSFCMVCLTKNIVRVPNKVYIWRQRPDSLCHTVLSVDKRIHQRVRDIALEIMILDKFMKKFDLFNKNPEYKYKVFEFFVNINVTGLSQILQIYSQIPAFRLDALVRKEFEQIEDTTALITFLFGRMNNFNIDLIRQSQTLRQQQEIIQNQAAKINDLQRQLANAHDVFNM